MSSSHRVVYVGIVCLVFSLCALVFGKDAGVNPAAFAQAPSCTGDFNLNGQVEESEIQLESFFWHTSLDYQRVQPYDVNGDGHFDIVDTQIVAGDLGPCSAPSPQPTDTQAAPSETVQPTATSTDVPTAIPTATATATVPASGPITVRVKVNSSIDDAYDTATEFNQTSPLIPLGIQGTNIIPTTGFVFRNVPVPRGAAVLNAYLYYWVGALRSEYVRLRVYADPTGSAGSPPSARPRTAASADWVLGRWDGGCCYTSSDLSAPVQEVISGGGWNWGNPIGIITTFVEADGYGQAVLYSYDHSPDMAAELVITYQP